MENNNHNHNNLIKIQEPAIYRILDANLDRAREGLRIIEEWCRFGLNDRQLSFECKKMRQELGSWHHSELKMARDTPNDPGTDLSHPEEEKRDSIEQLLRVNISRVEEALRVLEEYGKLYNLDMAKAVKQMRYNVYTLESSLLGFTRHKKLDEALLYLVTSPVDNIIEVVETALQAGLNLVQYRHKKGNDWLNLSQADKLSQLCHAYGALFIVNDRVDFAQAVNADGVHLGQQDMPISVARELLGWQKLIGRSTTNPEEMKKAIEEGADYIGVGPVYETPTKADKPAAGLDYVRYAAKNAEIPWFAIGGIDTNNLIEVLKAGGERVAVVRAIMESDKPDRVTQYLISQLVRKQNYRRLEVK